MGDGRSQFQFEREMEVSECQAELLDRLVPGAALDLVGRGISRHLHEYEPLLCANDVSLNSIFHSATHLRGDGLRTRMSISLVGHRSCPAVYAAVVMKEIPRWRGELAAGQRLVRLVRAGVRARNLVANLGTSLLYADGLGISRRQGRDALRQRQQLGS